MTKRMRLGIFGGSFDPIHLGHLLAASEAYELLSLSRVLFVTAARPPHKMPEADAEARHQMVLLATQDDERFEASRLELDREGPSYTVDTLRQAGKLYPEHELFFITGADAYADLDSWYQAEELSKLATLVGASRPGYDISRMHPFFRERTVLLKIPACEVSSTQVRERIKAGRTVRYLVVPKVEEYLAKHALYR